MRRGGRSSDETTHQTLFDNRKISQTPDKIPSIDPTQRETRQSIRKPRQMRRDDPRNLSRLKKIPDERLSGGRDRLEAETE